MATGGEERTRLKCSQVAAPSGGKRGGAARHLAPRRRVRTLSANGNERAGAEGPTAGFTWARPVQPAVGAGVEGWVGVEWEGCNVTPSRP